MAGRSTLVLDVGAIGTGCSGRNGGQVAYSIKPSFRKLCARHGEQRAFALCREGLEAISYLRALATSDGLDCGWRESGCFFGAHTPHHFARMARDAEHQPAGLQQRISVVPRAEQHLEVATDFYHGGCLYHDDASVDPMKLLRSLLQRAQDSGAVVQDHCAVTGIQRAGGGFEVRTTLGVLKARKVLLATNGYSGPLSSWHQRRVIPIGSYQIATAALGKSRIRAMIPRARNIVDSRRVVIYFRPSLDEERIVFGGRAALAELDPLTCVPRLQKMLAQILPELRSVPVTHAWVGWVAYTFDTLPHLGQQDGLYYCMGYCGQGVPLAPYFGSKIGRQMADLASGRTALDDLPFSSRPYYFGKPWFLAPSVWAYRALDAAGV